MVADASTPLKNKPREIKVSHAYGGYNAYGYRSASVGARDGRAYNSGSGDAHMVHDRLRLINQSRVFYNDNAIYSGLINRAVSYIAGDVSLQCLHKNKNHCEKVEKLWKEFWKKPEIRGILTGRQVIEMVCREILLAGDTAVIKTNKKLIQLIEAEQIAAKRKENAPDGIQKDSYGKPLKYYVSPYSKTGSVDIRRSVGYKPVHFLFITDPKRPSATRSVPPSQASFSMLHRINDTCDSEAIAMQLLSRIAVSVTREGGPEEGFNGSSEDETANNTDLALRLTELGTALIFHGEKGDKIEGVNHNIPGKDFGDTIRMFLRLLGLPLGLPLEVILLDWTESNYSQSRAVLEQAYQMFKGWQELLKSAFLSEVFRWKYKQWVKDGLIQPRKDGDDHEWIMATFPWLDQLKEAKAHAAKIDRSMETHAQACKSLNLDRDVVVATRVKEMVDAIEKAQEIEKKTGVKVPWQPLCGMEIPGASSKFPDDEDDDDKSKKKKKKKQKGQKDE